MREVIVCESPKIIMIHGDCMEYMATLEPKAFELAIVDPPYGLGKRISGGKTTQNGFKRGSEWSKMSDGWDTTAPNESYFQDLRTFTSNQIIWGANYYPQYMPASMGWIFWDKLQDNFSFSDGEIAASSFDSKTRVVRIPRGSETAIMTGIATIHPTQKPVKLYKWLLKNYAKPGDRILDTHGGSFSSVIACYQMGFDFVGIEKDEEYFEKALRRVELAVSQGHFLTEE